MPPVPGPKAGTAPAAGRRRRRTLLRLALALPLALCAPGPAAAQISGAEREVKAAYLLKFAAFVEWPESSFAGPGSALTIGVAGNEELAEQLEQMMAGRNVNGRALALRRLRRGDAPAGLHMLFIGAIEPAAQDELLSAVRGLPLLTVSDAGAAPGCMIHFVLVGDRLRFEVVLPQVNSSHLRISARMLAAALKVVGASS